MSRNPSFSGIKTTLLSCPAGVSLIYLVDDDLFREPGVAWAILEDEGQTGVDVIGIFGSRLSGSSAIEMPDGRVFDFENEYTNAEEWRQR